MGKDATVFLTAAGMGVSAPREDGDLSAALAELRAAASSYDKGWLRRAQARVDRLRRKGD